MAWSGYQKPSGWTSTIRPRILRRDPICCLQYVDCTTTSTTVDHRVPVSQGGGHEDANLQGACKSCHDIKSEAERQFGVDRKNPKRARRSHPSEI